MTWLVWKEYRANLLVVIVGAALLLMPYLFAVGLAAYGAGPDDVEGWERWARNLVVAGIYSVILSQLTLALLGGNLIAGERADRSAEFQAYLPIAKVKILAGKLTLALAATLLIWLPSLLILVVLTWGHPLSEIYEKAWPAGSTTAMTGLAFFCIAWFVSSFQRSPTFAVCAGVITPYFVLMAIAAVAWMLGYEPEHFDPFMLGTYRATCLALTPLCFVLGTWLYLRRVEP